MNETPAVNQHWKKHVILFLTSQTLSLFGSSLVQYAIMWYITLKTQSGLMMTISIICGFLPTFFLAPFAGVWADRYDRKRLIILSDAMIAACTMALAVVFWQGHEAMWLLFLASAVRSVGSAIQMPAVNAFVPQLVPEDKLLAVNGVNGSIQAVIMLISPMVSGALMTFAPIEGIFMIDVVTATMAIGTMALFLKVAPHPRALEKHSISYFEDLKMGFDYINNHSYVKRFFFFCAILFFLVAPAAFLTPLQVTRSFGDDVWRLTAIEISFSVGMMLGGMVMASWGGFKNRVHSMIVSNLAMGVCTVLLGITTNFPLYLAFMGLIGLGMPLFNTPATVLLQEKVEDAYLGRVFGVMAMISSSMMPLGMLIFGPMADAVQIELILVATGLLLSALSFFMLRSKQLVAAGAPKAVQIETESEA